MTHPHFKTVSRATGRGCSQAEASEAAQALRVITEHAVAQADGGAY